jgi:carboxyl-terminal processing protease
VDSLDEQAIYRRAATGMLDELDDPYAVIVPGNQGNGPGPYRPVSVRGMYLDLDGGVVTVVAVIAGSAADLAGVRAGDAVLEAQGATTEGLRPEDVATRLAGTGDVRLRLARAGVAPLRVTVLPAPPQPVPAPVAGPMVSGVAHVRIAGLNRSTAATAAELIAAARSSGARALVLDLRSAVEGDLDAAVSLASLFLPRGATVVVTKGREGPDSTVVATSEDGRFPDLPTVVLVDRGTAGAAEVVAGAMQDHDRALIVGEPSFGRGVSVSYFPLGDGSSLRLTTALWRTASGRVLQRPSPPEADAEVPEGRPEFQTASKRVVFGGGGVVPDREVESSTGDRAAGDRDAALTLARKLLADAPTTRVLLSLDSR